MALTTTDPVKIGMLAPDFYLPATDGRHYSLADVRGRGGLVVAFICNHCPYVKAITDRLVTTAATLRDLDVGFVAISANDAQTHPDDSFDNMKTFARENGFAFPYLYDESQKVARAYGAVCTPDFFGFNGKLLLQYRGRLDAGRTDPPPPDAPAELVEAMRLVAETGKGPDIQYPSMGCSIKWKAA